MVFTKPSHGIYQTYHGVFCGVLVDGHQEQALAPLPRQPGSQPAPFQEHLDPFPPQVDPLYWLLIKGLGRSYSEGARKGLAAGRDWR